MEGEGSRRKTALMEETRLCINQDDVICPICLNFPHNCVLLQCSSYEKGCRPFLCDTDHLQSNCFDRYKEANGQFLDSDPNRKPACPLCRGEVTGWTVVDKARMHLDVKTRCCEEEKCTFIGTYIELQKHAELEHPLACPSKVDPARRLDWENLQRSSELIDVLTTIHSEVPNGIILGDYVVEYDEDNPGDDVDDVHGDEGKWWRSCMLYQIFGSFAICRNRRSRVSDSRNRSSHDTSNSDEGSVSSSGEHAERNVDDVDGEFAGSREISRERAGQRSSRRHLSHSNDI